jgi:hypothetical protein
LDFAVNDESATALTLEAPDHAGEAEDGVRAAHATRRTPRSSLRRWVPCSLTVWFLVIAIPMGVFLVFAIPAFQGLDEPNHFARIWSVTNGTMVVPVTHSGQRSVDIGGARATVGRGAIRRGLISHGVVVDGCLAKYMTVNLADAARDGPMKPALSFHTPAPCAASPNVFELIDNTAVNAPLAYAPQVAAVGVLRLAGAPLPLIFYGGRLFGLAVYLALVALALRIAPRGKALLFVVGLLPMSLQSAATYNADSLLLAASLLAVALTIRCCVDEEAGWRWFAALTATVWLVAWCKEPYGLLALLALLVPSARLTSRPLRGVPLTTRVVSLVKAGVVVIAAASSALWYELGVKGASLAAQYPPHDINQHVQSYVLVHHPLTALTTIWHTLVDTTQQQFTILSTFLELGFFRNQPGGSVAPVTVAVVGILALFVAFTSELAGGRFTSRWASGPAVLRTAWWWLPTLVVAVLVASFYVQSFVRDTPAGAFMLAPLDGIVGRYFLPLMAVPMVSVAMADGTGTRRVPKPWLVGTMAALSVFLIVKVFTRFW